MGSSAGWGAVLGGEQRWVGSSAGWGAALGGEQCWVGSSARWGAALGGLGFQTHTHNLIIKCQSKLPIEVVLTYI